MKLITFTIEREESWRAESPMIAKARIETDAGVKMDVQFTPELSGIAVKGIAEMCQVALRAALAPLHKERIQDPTLQLTVEN